MIEGSVKGGDAALFDSMQEGEDMLRGLMRLEERIVLDASVGDDGDGDGDGGDDVGRILVVDTSRSGADALADAARDGVTVVRYDSGKDTLSSLLAKIHDAGSGFDAIASVAFANHGTAADMRLTADGALNLAELADNPELADFWRGVADMLADDGRIDLLSCDLYRGEEGRMLLDALEALTGANFAASDNATGNPEFGGDWLLESDGVEVDQEYFHPDLLADFSQTLMTYNILLVDINMPDYDVFGPAAYSNVIVIEYDSFNTTLAQLLGMIKSSVSGTDDIGSVGFATLGGTCFLYSFASDGYLTLDQVANNQELRNFFQEVGQIADRIDLFCTLLTAYEPGPTLLQEIENVAGIPVAGSSDATDNSGGNWILETGGNINLGQVYFDPAALPAGLNWIGVESMLGGPDMNDEQVLLAGQALLAGVPAVFGSIMFSSNSFIVTIRIECSPNLEPQRDLLDLSPLLAMGVVTSETESPGTFGEYYDIPSAYDIVISIDVDYDRSIYLQVQDAVNSITVASDVRDGYDRFVSFQFFGYYPDGSMGGASCSITAKSAPEIVDPGPGPGGEESSDNWDGGGETGGDDPGEGVPDLPVSEIDVDDGGVEEGGEDGAGPIADQAAADGDEGGDVFGARDDDSETGLGRLEEEILGFTVMLADIADTSGGEAAGRVSADVTELQSGMTELGRNIRLLLGEFALVGGRIGEALQPTVSQLVRAWQREISFAGRVVSLAGDTVREWASTPAEQRDGQLADRMVTFSEKLAEINARVAATLAGVHAASDMLASAESDAAPALERDAFLDKVTGFIDDAYGRIRSEMERRDSVFFDLELLKLKRGEVAAVEQDS